MALARGFEQAGAAALSVLTEEENFQGALAHLRDARRAVALPVLRKDFIVERVAGVGGARGQRGFVSADRGGAGRRVAAGRCWRWGANWAWSRWSKCTRPENCECALAAGARIVGVNNRDLHTLEVRVETSLELIEAIPDDCIAVSESGLRSAEDLRAVARRRIRRVSDRREA